MRLIGLLRPFLSFIKSRSLKPPVCLFYLRVQRFGKRVETIGRDRGDVVVGVFFGEGFLDGIQEEGAHMMTTSIGGNAEVRDSVGDVGCCGGGDVVCKMFALEIRQIA